MSKNRRNQKPEIISRSVRVPLEEWEKFERFQKSFDALEETVSEIKSAWQKHIQYLKDEYNLYGIEEEFVNFVPELSRCNRLLKKINVGVYPPEDISDEELEHYSDKELADRCYRQPHYKKKKNYNSYPKPIVNQSHHPQKPLYVRVIIEDISNGEL